MFLWNNRLFPAVSVRTAEHPHLRDFNASPSGALGESCLRELPAVSARATTPQDFPALFLFPQSLRGNWNLNKSQCAHSVLCASGRDRTSLSLGCSIKLTFCFQIQPSIILLNVSLPQGFIFKINTSSSLNSSYILTVHRYSVYLPTRVCD